MGSPPPHRFAWLALVLLAIGARSRADEPPPGDLGSPPPALTARLAAPDQQLARLLDLFRGSRAASPASALAGWKRATSAVKPFSKQTDALITILNPSMVPELRTLEGASATLGFDPNGQRRWAATIPADDGTFAALATALALSGGKAEDPIGPALVDRLGPEGSALMARAGASVIVGNSRQDLQAALEQLPLPPPPPAEGLHFRLDPAHFGSIGPLNRRRLVEGLRGLGCRELAGIAKIDGEAVSMVVTGRWPEPPAGAANPAIDPTWLESFPSDRTLAAVVLAVDPRPETWNTLFAAADRVDKADPAHAKLAPLRSRLNLLALVAGLRPEADLWPHLRGFAAAATLRPGESTPGALVALHLDGEAAATRLVEEVIPRLLAQFKLANPDAPATQPARRIAKVAGQPLEIARRGATVLLAWGEGNLVAALDAADHPEHSAGPALRDHWGAAPPNRLGMLWPGRLPITPEGSPLATALTNSPPLTWSGTGVGPETRDELRWEGPRDAIRRFLDRLPMDPPPDRSTAP